MEEMSPAVAVPLSLGSPMCENAGISNHMEITRLKIVTDTAMLLSDPASLLHADSSTNWDGSCNGIGTEGSKDKSVSPIDNGGVSKMLQKTQNNEIVGDAIMQESKEDEVLLVRDDRNGINGMELLPLEPTSEMSLPIAVQIEGINNGQILAKVISLEERSFERKVSEDNLTTAAQLNEENSSVPTLKASVVALQLPNEKDPVKGGMKSVFELECVPLWGSVSICGQRPEIEDAIMVVPHFMRIPIKMFIGDRVGDGISQTLSHLTSHFFGVYDGHGGSQVANYCRDRIHMALGDELKDITDDLVKESLIDTRQMQWEKVFTTCFLKVDDEVGGKVSRNTSPENVDSSNYASEPVAPETVGSTAVVAILCSSHIIVANCGDSRAVLYRGKEAVVLSIDHKPNREDEYARIEASGGKVIQWNGHRVFGVLAMSRSIGDRYLKPWIIPTPEVMFLPRAREDECLVLASDGLWDVMTNEEACEVARRRILLWHKKNGTNPLPERGRGVDPAAQAAAEYLSMLALQKGSKDDISVIVIDLKARRKGRQYVS
ncbi:protein phosphatase 2C 16-like isoform X1 [Coffea eugenioides]|uniref:protein-serine/threonine phosphatase n=2 Tax=Coffea arabica TaxID=13443 RepID=A0A6P6XK21_COFAR|nr:protein phosphatase 2C 16-like isoform X1 [Coffea eugenioides]XP_027168492.1 protein phosphatase 2C 16-like isoform X1 [Coffea eugenioides]XP_027168493.1 protein phosphatase 2C 16-like isoform X1 [Coffea eugenioides]